LPPLAQLFVAHYFHQTKHWCLKYKTSIGKWDNRYISFIQFRIYN